MVNGTTFPTPTLIKVLALIEPMNWSPISRGMVALYHYDGTTWTQLTPNDTVQALIADYAAISMRISERRVFGNTMATGPRSPLQTRIFWGPIRETWSPISRGHGVCSSMMARPGLCSPQTTRCRLSLRLSALDISMQITERWVFGNTMATGPDHLCRRESSGVLWGKPGRQFPGVWWFVPIYELTQMGTSDW